MKLALQQWLGHRFGQWVGHSAWGLRPTQVASSNSSLMYWVEQVSQFIVQQLVAGAEPSVWYTCDAEGHLWWHAYDPVTDRSLNDMSEAEMRAWIERRYTTTLVN